MFFAPRTMMLWKCFFFSFHENLKLRCKFPRWCKRRLRKSEISGRVWRCYITIYLRTRVRALFLAPTVEIIHSQMFQRSIFLIDGALGWHFSPSFVLARWKKNVKKNDETRRFFFNAQQFARRKSFLVSKTRAFPAAAAGIWGGFKALYTKMVR